MREERKRRVYHCIDLSETRGKIAKARQRKKKKSYSEKKVGKGVQNNTDLPKIRQTEYGTKEGNYRGRPVTRGVQEEEGLQSCQTVLKVPKDHS